MSDKLDVQGILSKGYGLSPKLVMQDREITIEAKAIYSYFSSYAGNGTVAFPSVSKTIYDLNIGEQRYYKHRKKLTDKGYLTIEKQVSKRGKFSHNLYTLPPFPENTWLENDRSENQRMEDVGTNSNSTNNNSINSNNNNENINLSKNENIKDRKKSVPENIASFYEDNFGRVSNYIQKELIDWLKIFDSQLIIEALKRTKDYGKEFAYTKKIMMNWNKLNVKTLEDIKKIDKEFENKRNKINFKKKKIKKEKLPDWAKEDFTPRVSGEDVKDPDLESRLKRLREENSR